MLRTTLLAAAALSLAMSLALAGAASAAEQTVKELNNGPSGVMAFEPLAVKLKPGDSLRFQPADAGHNVESVPGMAPAGADPIRVPMGKEQVITFTKPGIYGIRCVPHYGMGMVMLVEVGQPTNLADAKAAADKAPPMAKKRFAAAFAKLGL